MESAATPTKPKRKNAVQGELFPASEKPRRYRKVAVDAAPAAPMSHRERLSHHEARVAETRKRVQAEYEAKGYGPMPRTSYRWMKPRTKGLPFSRMLFVNAIPGLNGARGLLVLRHPTKNRVAIRPATDELLKLFMPSLPAAFTASMLGMN